MLTECQLSSLKKGIELFNKKEFFDSHEIFEDLWQEAEDPERAAFLFLVRLAAAGTHLLNQNYSCLFLWQIAQAQLKQIEINFLDVQSLDKQLEYLINTLNNSKRLDLEQIAKNCKFQLTLV